MINITIASGQISYELSVLGLITGKLNSAEMVDDNMLHIEIDGVFRGINVHQFTFNSTQFDNALEAVEYLQTLIN